MSLRAIKLLDFGASPEAWNVLEDASNWRGVDRTGWNFADPQFFMPPQNGVAGNGLPIYNWDQAAAQLGRESTGWAGVGNPANVTFAFRATMVGAMPSGTSGFVAFTEAQIAMTLESLALWSEVANITFTRIQETDGYSNNATMLFSNYTAGAEGASAFAYYPGSTGAGSVAGDVWINFSLETNNSNLVEGAFGPHTMAHEIGHAIGIAHPANYDASDDVDPVYPDSAAYWQDGRMFTVMSYFGSAALGGSLNAFASGPQLHDIAAAQRLYGANMSTRTGDTVYGFNSNTGHAHFTITADGQSPVFAIWDAGGNDTIDFSGFSTAVEIDLREEAFSSAGPGNGGVGVAIGNVSIARGAIIENGIGGLGNDTLIGNNVANVLDGRFGADVMSGNGGDDTYYVDNASDIVTENLNEGSDTVRTTLVSYTLATNVENLILETGAVNGTGNGLANAITGNAANNILDGSAGADTMIGGNGDDTYVVDDAGDVTTEGSALGGTDTVQSSVTRTLTANIENLVLTGAAAISGFGNALANTIAGNGAANQLNGFDGADVLDGGVGADNMFGGNGDDTYYVDNAGDQTTEVSALGGTDIVFSSVGRNLTANIENLTLTGSADITGSGNAINNIIIGNSGVNTLYGFDGNDRLDGGAGADTLFGANGDDTYVVDDAGDITVEGSALGGVDTVETYISRNLNANFENMTLLGSATIAYGNVINNVLTGNALVNALYGFDGNDTLDGGAGADNMFGGNGDDTYYVDNAGDVTSEASALGGADTVISSVARNLNANIENLTLTGGGNITGAGNILNNVIIGNSGANTLYGLDGNDRLDGGLGADTLQGGAGADEYVFSTALGGGNVDGIVGFNVADDTIVLSNAIFTGLAIGALDAGAFVNSTAAADADDRIIFNSVTGQIFFDADGDGGGAAILFATLNPGLALTSADFIVGGP